MPASSRSIPLDAADDIWLRHEAQIKDLYQNQRKTLREVKHLMEENGFPKKPLSTWESKLRERLQLRKKAKSHDWPLIYRHVLPRLEHPRKKQLKRKTIIRLNGSEIPWDKVWKEIRRSGALDTDSRSTSPGLLPPEVTIRSPPPGPFTSLPTREVTQPVIPAVSTRSDRTISSAVVPLQTPVVAPSPKARSLMYSFSVYLLQWCASSIPWLEMCQSMQHMFRDEKHTRQLEASFSSILNEFLATSSIARAARSQTRNELTSSGARMDLLQNERLIPPRPSPDLGYRVAKSGGQIKLSQFISTATFLLSNKLHDREDCDQGLGLLCSLLDRSAALTTTLLGSHLPSIRAAWESLLNFSIETSRRDTVRVLTGIGIQKHWMNPSLSAHCLRCAVEMDCYDIVNNIVVYCCDSNHSHWWRDSLEAILAACRKGNAELASLLIQRCNVNARRIRSGEDRSMFQELVAYLEGSDDEHSLALELFLANGASVDTNTSRKRITRRWRELAGRHELLDATRPTILDEIFYMNRSLFNKARPYSRVPVSGITRTGLLVALEDSSQTLRDYLSARLPGLPSFTSRHVQLFLELLLAEQFRIPRKVNLRIVRSLFEFGVDFDMPSIRLDIRDFWRTEEYDVECYDESRRGVGIQYAEFSWHQYTNLNDRLGLLNMLLTQGGVIGEHVLEGAVTQYGTSGLECIASHLTNFPGKAVRALIRAARSNNFEDVEFLLQKGVDPNAFIISHGLSYSVQAVATQTKVCLSGASYYAPDGGCSLEMTQLLARHGARLVVTPEDSTPFDFANHLLQQSNLSDLFARIKYALGMLTKDKAPSRLPSFLLESCIAPGYRGGENKVRETNLEIFEWLFRQGAEVSPGSPLAALVYLNGREKLVRDVLYSGSDINAYWVASDGSGYTPLQAAALQADEALVRLFLQKGANVNSPPYPNNSGPARTALQFICWWSPATEEEHQRKMRICHLLIDQGADVNPASSIWSPSTLWCAAAGGDLELATLLLREGADINATWGHGTALDAAAVGGRLDMVKFLLNANALSCVRGATGFDGAIHKAEQNGLSAITDLIREHAAKVEAGTVFNPELLRAQDECRVYGFGTDDDSSDDDAEDVGIAGGTPGPMDTESGYRGAAKAVQVEQVCGEPSNFDTGFVLSEGDFLLREYVQPTDVLGPTESWTGKVAINTVAEDVVRRPGEESSLFDFGSLAGPAL